MWNPPVVQNLAPWKCIGNNPKMANIDTYLPSHDIFCTSIYTLKALMGKCGLVIWHMYMLNVGLLLKQIKMCNCMYGEMCKISWREHNIWSKKPLNHNFLAQNMWNQAGANSVHSERYIGHVTFGWDKGANQSAAGFARWGFHKVRAFWRGLHKVRAFKRGSHKVRA